MATIQPASIDIEVECDCGERLRSDTDRNGTVVVQACPECWKKAKAEGKEEAEEERQDG